MKIPSKTRLLSSKIPLAELEDKLATVQTKLGVAKHFGWQKNVWHWLQEEARLQQKISRIKGIAITTSTQK